MRWRIPRRFGRLARAGFAMAMGSLAVPVAWLMNTRTQDALDVAIGQMLMLGFYGNGPRSVSARLLAAQVRSGRVGGVFFVLQNIGRSEEVAGLITLFREGGADPMLAIDHEGGVVQRLTAAHGFTPLPCAREIAATLSPRQAQDLYATAGRELADFGFTVNLAPVVDVDSLDSPAVGAFGRSFHTDPERIATFAAAAVDGFAAAGILCALKHFPGHGQATDDSHDGLADVSDRWTEAELLPFARLIANGRAAMIMGGHLRLRALEPNGDPITVSRAAIGDVLRGRLGFTGVVVTDDLDMGALSGLMDRRTAVIRAIAAGNDLLLIKNLFGYDPALPRKVASWVRCAIAERRLSEGQVFDAAKRIGAARARAVEAATAATRPGR